MGRLDLVSILGSLFLGLILSLLFVTSPEAKDVCLRIAVPEIHIEAEGIDLYRRVMEEAGLCVKPSTYPQVRAIAAIQSGKIDGVLAGQEDFPELVDVPVMHGDVVLARLPGFLIVPEGPITSFWGLHGEVLGVPLGATWPRKLISGYPNIVKVPRGAEMLKEMLQEGRIDVMLLDGYSLQQTGGVPDGYKAIPVENITVYSWLRAEFADFLPKFDIGTKAYLKAVGYDG